MFLNFCVSIIMNVHAGRHVLKVDCTSITIEQSENQDEEQLMIFYNVNIPETIVNNNIERRTVFERVKNLLINDFRGSNVVYQICASYYLKHIDTDEKIVWSGSFFAKNNNPSRLLNFQVFDSAQFVDICFIDTENVDEKLRNNNFDTKWQYDRLISVIVNIQAQVLGNHYVVRKRNLRLNARRHITFPLP